MGIIPCGCNSTYINDFLIFNMETDIFWYTLLIHLNHPHKQKRPLFKKSAFHKKKYNHYHHRKGIHYNLKR